MTDETRNQVPPSDSVASSARQDSPTPEFLVQTAMTLKPDGIEARSEDEWEKALIWAYRRWEMARAVIEREGKSEEDILREAAVQADRLRGKSSDSAPPKYEWTIEEACEELDYKRPRSFFALLKRAVDAGKFAYCQVDGGLLRWIETVEKVDGQQLRILLEFKKNRAVDGRRKGGLAKAARQFKETRNQIPSVISPSGKPVAGISGESLKQ